MNLQERINLLKDQSYENKIRLIYSWVERGEITFLEYVKLIESCKIEND